ncbi:MAG: hypothetical protein KJ048_08875 [Dehalococcoidia bacterium]|nr:hypothetical protein [Dehalococcoidia bacterium]
MATSSNRFASLVAIGNLLEFTPPRLFQELHDLLDDFGVPPGPGARDTNPLDAVLARLQLASDEQLSIIKDALVGRRSSDASKEDAGRPRTAVGADLISRIPLENEQRELLATLVEASWNLPSDQRQKFQAVAPVNGADRIEHAGLPVGRTVAYRGDWEALAAAGLIQTTPRPDGQIVMFDVSPLGFAYYRELRSQAGAMDEVAAEVVSLIDDDDFVQAHPSAAERWRAAHQDLWSADSNGKLTDIGHKCREAIQMFADGLIRKLELTAPKTELSKDQSRIFEVTRALAVGRGEAESALLTAVATYWKAASDLVQRQEHGSQKAAPLIWEDARRVVFQTAVVMYELHRLAERYRR